MYKVIKQLAGFELNQIINQDDITKFNINDEILKSWELEKYIEKVSKQNQITETKNANNTIL